MATFTTIGNKQEGAEAEGVKTGGNKGAASSAFASALTAKKETLHGEEMGVLSGHASKVVALVALSGGRLASAAEGRNGADKAVRVWDTETMRCLFTLEQEQPTNKLWVLRDGRLTSGSKLGALYVWDVDAERDGAREYLLKLQHTGAV